MSKKLLSIIVPVFNEEDSILPFYEKVEETTKDIPVDKEYIFIDDGSTDSTLKVLNSLYEITFNLHYISFSRNFGKESALYAGLKKSKGNYVVVMDVDLQDPPELLPLMFDDLENNNYDAIATMRSNRDGEPKIRSFFSASFYKIINKISETQFVPGARDYRMMTRQMVDAILTMSEKNRFSKGIFSWVGFHQKYIPFKNQERKTGKTSWSFWSLFKYAIDGIVSFSTFPLFMVTIIGLITFIMALLGAIFVIGRAITSPGSSAFGWASLIVVLLGVSGIQLLSIGIIGQYISKIYIEAKDRPIYIAKDEK